MERKVTQMVKKWFGLPRCLTDISLYSKKTALVIPVPSVAEEFKVGKVRVHDMLVNSEDMMIKENPPTVETGRKWKAQDAFEQAVAEGRIRDIVGHVREKRQGIRMVPAGKLWNQATKKEKRKIVESEIRAREEDKRLVRTVGLVKQGSWGLGDEKCR